MMRVAERASRSAPVFLDFALQDTAGTIRTSHEFLDAASRLAFFMGGWAPDSPSRCGSRGGKAGDRGVGRPILFHSRPIPLDHIIISTARKRRHRLSALLSDPANGFGAPAGSPNELSAQPHSHTPRRGRTFAKLHGDTRRRLPVPSSSVSAHNARIVPLPLPTSIRRAGRAPEAADPLSLTRCRCAWRYSLRRALGFSEGPRDAHSITRQQEIAHATGKTAISQPTGSTSGHRPRHRRSLRGSGANESC